MGWYGTPGKSKQNIIDEILDDFRTRNILKEHKVVCEDDETILWAVVAGINEKGKDYQYIVCYLINQGGNCWGYKPMDETVGPCYYSVPQKWLDKYPCIVPGSTGYSNKWREKVRST